MVIFGKHVQKDVDKTAESKAGVITPANEHFDADSVVGANGVGSKSWQPIQEIEIKTRSSGFAVYCVAFSTEVARQNSIVAEHFPIPTDGWVATRVAWAGYALYYGNCSRQYNLASYAQGRS